MSKTHQLIKLAETLEDKYAATFETPLKCKMGMHKWGPLVKVRIKHESKPGEKQWAHHCDAERRFCERCGKNGPLENVCSGHITPLFEGKKDDAIMTDNFGDFSAER
jgi:hypothetical protein